MAREEESAGERERGKWLNQFLGAHPSAQQKWVVGGKSRRPMLAFVNVNRKIRKHTDTEVAFTQEYSEVSYLSSEKQWLKNLIVDIHVC